MQFNDSMYYRNISTFDLKDQYFSSLYWLVLVVCEKEKISSEEGRLHTTTACKGLEALYSYSSDTVGLGHIGIRSTVPCREFVLISEVNLHRDTVEPLNKRHIGIRSTVPCRESVLSQRLILHRDTVKPLNKGHIGTRSTVPCREAVLISEVNLHRDTVEPLNKGHIGIRSTVPCREAVLISKIVHF